MGIPTKTKSIGFGTILLVFVSRIYTVPPKSAKQHREALWLNVNPQLVILKVEWL